MLTFAVQLVQKASVPSELDLNVPAGHASQAPDVFRLKPALHENVHAEELVRMLFAGYMHV
jgi:hypothetical protein